MQCVMLGLTGWLRNLPTASIIVVLNSKMFMYFVRVITHLTRFHLWLSNGPIISQITREMNVTILIFTSIIASMR